MSHKPYGPYEKFIKRPQDFVCALLAIIVLSPVMIVTAVLVRAKLGSPVLFKQDRPGINGKIFKVYKFRTMTSEVDDNGKLLPDEVRLTSFGKKLRATSLDELPELFNILRGDMSVVGPRPLMPQYLPRYNKHQARRQKEQSDVGADIFNRGLCLPSDIKMTEEEQERVIEIVKGCFE